MHSDDDLASVAKENESLFHSPLFSQVCVKSSCLCFLVGHLCVGFLLE